MASVVSAAVRAAVFCATFAALTSAQCGATVKKSKPLPGLTGLKSGGTTPVSANGKFDFTFTCDSDNNVALAYSGAGAPSTAPKVPVGSCGSNVIAPDFWNNFLVAGDYITQYDTSIVTAQVLSGCPASADKALDIQLYDPTANPVYDTETCSLSLTKMSNRCTNLDAIGQSLSPPLASGCMESCLRAGLTLYVGSGHSAAFSSDYWYDARFNKPEMANCDCKQTTGNLLTGKFGLSNDGIYPGGLRQKVGPAAGKGVLMGPLFRAGGNDAFFYPIDTTTFQLDIDATGLLTNQDKEGGAGAQCEITYQVVSGACMGTVAPPSNTGLIEALLALSVGAIIGIAIGGAVLVLLIVVFITVCCCGMTCFLCAKRRQPVGIAKSAPVVRVQK